MTAENKTACVEAINGHGYSSANSADDMWTAIDGDNLPQGIDMVVLDNAMAIGSEDALACLAALHSKPQTEYFEKTNHDQVIVSYTMERLDRMEQTGGKTENNNYVRINTIQDLGLENMGMVYEQAPPPPKSQTRS
tara:strand:- start:486 stop:893 length:408 start_codon:yes stop_codon:yes gene_type:complete